MRHITSILSFINAANFATNPEEQTPAKGSSTASPSDPTRAQVDQFMARCKKEERAGLEKRIKYFKSGIEVQQAADKTERVKELEEALGRAQGKLSHLNAICEEVAKDLVQNSDAKPISPPNKNLNSIKTQAGKPEEKEPKKAKRKRSQKKFKRHERIEIFTWSKSVEVLRKDNQSVEKLRELLKKDPKLLERLMRRPSGEEMIMSAFEV